MNKNEVVTSSASPEECWLPFAMAQSAVAAASWGLLAAVPAVKNVLALLVGILF